MRRNSKTDSVAGSIYGSNAARLAGQAVVALCIVASLIAAGALRSQTDDESGKGRTQVSTGAWITPLAAPGSAIYELHTDLRSDANAANLLRPTDNLRRDFRFPGRIAFGCFR
jgi:hypothetical protein